MVQKVPGKSGWGQKLGLPSWGAGRVSLPAGSWAGPLRKMLPWARSRVTGCQFCLSQGKGRAKPPVFFSKWAMKWKTEK